ncbi:MAG: metallophosphoesterase [Oscillospiraceae bacterium]|nr:metallophosphoesterase [Oscillospiraceae bacterium]
MKFVLATDIHYISRQLTQDSRLFEETYLRSDGKQMNYITEITDAFLEQVIQMKPDGGLILSGDITYNGERISHIEMAKKLERVRQQGIPVYVIPGNHDINNYRAFKYLSDSMSPVENISAREFREIYADCGYNQASFKDPFSLSYIVCPDEKLWLIMLDTCIYEENNMEEPSVSGGTIRHETLSWLDDCLYYAYKHNATPLVVGHHNLLLHNDVYNKNFTVNNYEELLELLARYEVPVYFSGHMHVQHIAEWKTQGREIYDVATSSLAVYQNQFGIINCKPTRSISYTTCRLDMENWAAKNAPDNDDLMNFKQYSAQFFEKLTYRKEFNKLINQYYSPQDADKMAQVIVKLNLAYFSGKVDNVQNEIIDSDGFKLWLIQGTGTTKRYILSMLKPVLQDNTCLILFSPTAIRESLE